MAINLQSRSNESSQARKWTLRYQTKLKNGPKLSNFGDIIITMLFCKQIGPIQVHTAIYILHLKRNKQIGPIQVHTAIYILHLKRNKQIGPIQVYTAIYILHLKRNIPYFKPHNIISYILHIQITSHTFHTPISHHPHCFPSPTSHIFTPNLPPPTFVYPQSPTSHFLCHPPPKEQ